VHRIELPVGDGGAPHERPLDVRAIRRAVRRRITGRGPENRPCRCDRRDARVLQRVAGGAEPNDGGVAIESESESESDRLAEPDSDPDLGPAERRTEPG